MTQQQIQVKWGCNFEWKKGTQPVWRDAYDSKADVALGMGDSGYLFCGPFHQLFGAARLRGCPAGDDPHPGLRPDRRGIDL